MSWRQRSGSVAGTGLPLQQPSVRRVSVTRAIRAALARIAEQSPTLGSHFDATIRTGTYCSYHPDPRAPHQLAVMSSRSIDDRDATEPWARPEPLVVALVARKRRVVLSVGRE